MPFINPLFLIIMIGGIKQLPAIIKELLCDYEWISNHLGMFDENNFSEL